MNTYDYHNIDKEKQKLIIYFIGIKWFFIWTNMNSRHLRKLCTKFSWNWLNGSDEDFQISSVYFHYFAIISPWKRKGWGLSFEQIWITITQGCFVPNLVEIASVVLEKMKVWIDYRQTDWRTDWRTTDKRHSEKLAWVEVHRINNRFNTVIYLINAISSNILSRNCFVFDFDV